MSGDKKRPTGGKGLVTLRVSDPRQDLDEQRKVIQKWLDEYGLSDNVVEWYSDVGSRLEAFKRQGFQALLKRVERGDIQWVVCETLDRFGCRSPAEYGKFICHLQDHGVKLYSVSEGIEATDDDAFTAITTTITGLRSTDELRSRSHRSLKGRGKLFREGEHGGGPPPYGFATACYDRLGVESWRVELVGFEQRVQIFPDGRRVEFNGKRNTPKKNKGETLRIVPSTHAERHQWVRKIFEWYTTEDIADLGIATRLNNLKVDALNGRGWSGPRIKGMLANPAYAVGSTVGNKSGRGKVLGLVGGQEVPVERVGGKTGRFVKRDQTDYVFPAQEREAIIDRATWDKAMAKAKTKTTRVKAPRSQNLWLSGLLVCAGCNRKMCGFRRKHGKEAFNYACFSHKTYGAACQCKLNKTPHRLVEAILDSYLKEANVKLDIIAGTGDPLGTMRALQLSGWSRQTEYLGTLAQMTQALHDAGIETGTEVDGQHYDTVNMKAEYRKLHEERQRQLGETIASKEEELRGFIRNIPKLSSELMIRMAEEEVDRLGREIGELKEQATYRLDERADELLAAIRDAQKRIGDAREALGGTTAGISGRHKSEAVRKVVKAIVLHYEPTENPKPTEPTSRLVRVVVEPLEGDPLARDVGERDMGMVPEEAAVRRIFARHHLLSRTFAACEIAAIVGGIIAAR